MYAIKWKILCLQTESHFSNLCLHRFTGKRRKSNRAQLCSWRHCFANSQASFSRQSSSSSWLIFLFHKKLQEEASNRSQVSEAHLNWPEICCRYDEILQAALQSAKHVGSIDEAINLSGDVLVEYDSQEHYEALTGRLGLLREWRVSFSKKVSKGSKSFERSWPPESPEAHTFLLEAWISYV